MNLPFSHRQREEVHALKSVCHHLHTSIPLSIVLAAVMPPSAVGPYGAGLPERYEIRRLEAHHGSWATALMMHSQIYQSEVWGQLYAGQQAKLCLQSLKRVTEAHVLMIKSGLTYGVFDKEYQFRRTESAATGGALYWSEFQEDDLELEQNGRELLRNAMDFPLVSVKMAYDASDSSPGKMLSQQLLQILPLSRLFFAMRPQGELESRLSPGLVVGGTTVHGPGEMLSANGTATVDGYMGQGLMKALAYFCMRNARNRGFRAIKIWVTSPAVHHVWMNAPTPCEAEVLLKTCPKDYETVINGERVKLFERCSNAINSAILVHLHPSHKREKGRENSW